MPNWKKVLTSGSVGELSSLFAPSITGSLLGTASYAVTASYVLPLQQDVLITGSLIVSSSGATNGLRVGTTSLIISGSQIAIGKTISNYSNPTVDINRTLIVSGAGIYTNAKVLAGNPLNPASGYQTAVEGYGNGYGGYFYSVSSTGPYGVYGYASDDGSEGSSGDAIGGKFEVGLAANDRYAVQLVDGTEGIGKVLVSQTSDGKAKWSTRLSGSYAITGSLTVSGSSTFTNIGPANFTGSLGVTGSWTLVGTGNVTGSMTISSSLNIIGTESITGSLFISGSTTDRVKLLLPLTSSQNISSSLDVIARTGSFDYIIDRGDAVIDGDLVVNGALTLAGGLQFGPTFATGSLTANANNLVIDNLANSILVRLSTTGGNHQLTGIVVPDNTKTFFINVFNVGTTGNIIFKNNDAGSTAQNRFLVGGDITVQPGEGLSFIYDPVDLRWRSPGKNI